MKQGIFFTHFIFDIPCCGYYGGNTEPKSTKVDVVALQHRNKNKTIFHRGVLRILQSHSLREEAAPQSGGTAVDTSVSPARHLSCLRQLVALTDFLIF